MPRSHFHEKLEAMEMELLTLGELAGNAVQNSVEAVMQQDDALAERVIAAHDARTDPRTRGFISAYLDPANIGAMNRTRGSC